MRLLIIGGYGNFGGGVARLLADAAGLEITIAGRSLERARAFCAGQPGLQPVAFDRDRDLAGQFAALRPDVVLDASGPFQAYAGHHVARACIAHGTHYLDLADGAKFVAGIGALDAAARARGVVVLSGVSTCPVLTVAVVRRLGEGMASVLEVQAGIAPSPHNSMGRSVIAAIAGYAGRAVPRRTGGTTGQGQALTETRHFTIAPPGRMPLRRRLFSLVDVPDLRALEAHWPGLREVWFGAGPSPGILHRAFIGLAWLVRLRLLPGLGALVPLIHAVSQRLRWGEHRGGMFVGLTGQDGAGRPMRREWHLVAEGPDGLLIPSMPAAILLRRMLAGDRPPPGARVAGAEVTLAEYEAVFARHAIHAGMREVTPGQPLFARLLGEAWGALPQPIRALHESGRAQGTASITRGAGLLARLAGGLVGFPPAGETPLRFTVTPGQSWVRQFGRHRFTSHLSARHGLLRERFGPLALEMALLPQGGALHWQPRRFSLLGLPLPLALGPRVRAVESVRDGRYHFDVELGHALTGLVIRYRGWLVPDG